MRSLPKNENQKEIHNSEKSYQKKNIFYYKKDLQNKIDGIL